MDIVPLLIIFLIIVGVNGVLNGSGPNECRSIETQSFYCCFNYEEINGTCVGCSIGYISQNGKPCTKCNANWSGHRCTSRCDCSLKQRCDHIYGCVPLTAPTHILTVTTTTRISRGITSASLESTEIENPITVTKETKTTTRFRYSGVRKMDMMIYIVAAAGAIGMFGVFLIGYASRRPIKRRLSIATRTLQNVYRGESIAVRPTGSHVYHSIEDFEFFRSNPGSNLSDEGQYETGYASSIPIYLDPYYSFRESSDGDITTSDQTYKELYQSDEKQC